VYKLTCWYATDKVNFDMTEYKNCKHFRWYISLRWLSHKIWHIQNNLWPRFMKPRIQNNIYRASSIFAFADMQISEKQSINRRQLESAANVTLMTSDPGTAPRPLGDINPHPDCGSQQETQRTHKKPLHISIWWPDDLAPRGVAC